MKQELTFDSISAALSTFVVSFKKFCRKTLFPDMNFRKALNRIDSEICRTIKLDL